MGYQPATYTIIKDRYGYYYVEYNNCSVGPYFTIRKARKAIKALINYPGRTVVEQYDNKGNLL